MVKQIAPLTREQQALVEEHIPLVRWVAQRYFNSNDNIVGLGLEELCQEGNVALCLAASSYKPGNAAFSTI